MNWEIAGSLGEIIGAVAVVISIVYLARQVTQANTTGKAATTLEASKLLSEWHGRLNQTPELAYLFIKGASDSSDFTEQEQARYLAAVAELFILLEGLYRQHQLGFFGDDAWRPLEKFLARMVQSPTIKSWWDSEIALNGEDFRNYVNQACEKYPETSNYADEIQSVVFK